MKTKTQATVKRTCPICYRYTDILIITRGGWEEWHCQSCGCRKDYRMSGRVN